VKAHTLDSYKDKYETVSFERTEDGVLTATVHEPGHPDQSLDYGSHPFDWNHAHVEWGYVFYDIARDKENEVVILTGAGNTFIGEEDHKSIGVDTDGTDADDAGLVGKVPATSPQDWDWAYENGIWLQMNLLNIMCPVIGAINGPALTHAELLLQSDIVIASDTAVIQDGPHFNSGLYIPGDGVGLVWPNLLGQNRGRYFLYTGERLTAQQALELGVVSEVVPRDQLLERAHVLARSILRRPRLVRRYTRQMLTQDMKMRMLNHLSHGLAMEGLAGAGRELDT